MLGTAKDEIAISDALWENSDQKALREQMDTDFKYWGPYDFQMDQTQGQWRSVTTPSGKTLGNKVKGLLQQSYMNLFIAVLEEERKKNKRIAATEKLAQGFIYQANRNNRKRPSGVNLQDAFSFYASVHGGTACSVLLTEDDGKIKSNIPYYDPYGCQFIEGEDGIIWFCYRENKNRLYIEKQYKKIISEGFDIGKSGLNDLITVYTFWDENEWKTAINGEYIDGDKHGLGYVPVFINPVGGIPPIMSEEKDISKYAWQSVYVNNRELIPIESELMSIEMTNAKTSARMRGIAAYDSNLTAGEVPEEVEKLVRMAEKEGQKDNVILLDKKFGAEWQGYIQPPDNAAAERFHQKIQAYSTMASIDPVTHGAFNRTGSGALASILRDASLEFIHPYSSNIENMFVFIAEECVNQFKAGNYPQVELVGRDAHRQPFNTKIKPDEVEEHYFSCELVADRLRDEAIEIGLAIQEVKAGLSDKRTAISKHNISTDPDRTLSMIEQERHAEMAAGDPIYHYTQMAQWYMDQGDDPVNQQMAAVYKVLAEGATIATVQEMYSRIGKLFSPSPEQTTPGSTQPDVAAEAGRLAAEPMTDMSNSIQAEVR